MPSNRDYRFDFIELPARSVDELQACRTFYSETFGWKTFDTACLDAYEKGIITEENALLYATKRGYVARGIDNIKKKRGEDVSHFGELRMKAPEAGGKKTGLAHAGAHGSSNGNGGNGGTLKLK